MRNQLCSDTALRIIGDILSDFKKYNPEAEVAIIAPFRDTVKELQKNFQTTDALKNLTIETVDRIQGMTVDYTIMYLPAWKHSFALDVRRFNVSTSRSGYVPTLSTSFRGSRGKSMQVRYEKVGRTDKDRRTGKEREPIDKAYYICQTYNRLGKNACTSHKIEARDLYNLVLSDIQEVAAMALKDKEAFYGRLSRRMEKQYLADKAKGILTEKRFLKLTDAMEKEQESNQIRMQEIAALISEEKHSEGDVRCSWGKSNGMPPLRSLMKRC